MERELAEELLTAAQAVVNDGEQEIGDFYSVDAEIFLRLKRAVQAIHDDAVKALDEELAKARKRQALRDIAKTHSSFCVCDPCQAVRLHVLTQIDVPECGSCKAEIPSRVAEIAADDRWSIKANLNESGDGSAEIRCPKCA